MSYQTKLNRTRERATNMKRRLLENENAMSDLQKKLAKSIINFEISLKQDQQRDNSSLKVRMLISKEASDTSKIKAVPSPPLSDPDPVSTVTESVPVITPPPKENPVPPPKEIIPSPPQEVVSEPELFVPPKEVAPSVRNVLSPPVIELPPPVVETPPVIEAPPPVIETLPPPVIETPPPVI